MFSFCAFVVARSFNESCYSRLARNSPSSLKGLAWSSTRGFACSATIRKRRRIFRKAEANPDTHPGTLKRLREKAAVPSTDLLRVLAEKKIGKPITTADRRAVWFEMRFKRYAPAFLGQVKPRMKLWAAALEESQLPLPKLPEIAVAGRSNSGKSTLVNYLCGRHSANMRRAPGSTTELVFWQIGKPARLCLVDLPGYGFALAPSEQRLQWTEFTLWYVRSRKNLHLLLMLIDARFGLKPADKEMIAYLERHHVKWQLVITKCDKVVPKDLARKMTILQEDVKNVVHMAGQPIPISALKKQGMDQLRAAIEKYRIQPDVLREGFKTRIYDLLELKRVRRAEKLKRQKEAARQAARRKANEEALIAEAAGAEDRALDAAHVKDFAANSNGETAGREDLHQLLGEVPPWGSRRPVSGSPNVFTPEPSDAVGIPKPTVTEAHYNIDDRDSRRANFLVTELFPNIVISSERVLERGFVDGQLDGEEQPNQAIPDTNGLDGIKEYLGPRKSTQFPTFDLNLDTSTQLTTPEVQAMILGPSFGEEDDSDGEDSMEMSATLPSVLRFEPQPVHAIGIGSKAPSNRSNDTSRFPGFPPDDRVELRSGRQRAGPSQDHIYEPDDFASAADRAAGKRARAPPAPDPENAGLLLAEARERYEREWAMELVDISHLRSATVTGPSKLASKLATSLSREANKSVTPKESPSHTQPTILWRLPGQPIDDSGEDREQRLRKRAQSRRGAEPRLVLDGRPAYVGRQGLRPIPKGHSARKLVGNKPARILKDVRQMEVAKAFGFGKDKSTSRRRNFGNGLNFEEAQSKWLAWYSRTKKKNFDLALQAESPQLEDVEAAFERRTRRFQRTRTREDSLGRSGGGDNHEGEKDRRQHNKNYNEQNRPTSTDANSWGGKRDGSFE